jgi:hypothetical protein
MPELVKMWQDRKDQPFDVLAVSVDRAKDRAKAEKAAKKWGLTFPVAHDPQLGKQLRVKGLPAVRLVGPSGADRYAAKGYSPESVELLAKQVDTVLAEIAAGDSKGQGQVVGKLWSRKPAEITQFVGVPGARSVAAHPGGAVVGLRGGLPMRLSLKDGALSATNERDVTHRRRYLSGRVGWLNGAVAAAPEGWWVWSEGTDAPWLATLTSPLQDMTVSGDHVWVAMTEGVVVLDGTGKKVKSFEGSFRDLSPDGSGGVWAVDGKVRQRFTIDGPQAASPAPGSWSVSSDGRWGAARVIQLLSGRFGPDGATRTVAVRQDGVLIGLDDDGQPALALSLRQAPVVAVVDVDGDARDEVLVVIRGQGVATLKMELP